MHFIVLNILIFLLIVFNPCITAAQQGPYKLDDIVVTASRIPAPLLEAQANITVITKEDIEQMGATTIIDIFKGEPGVFTANLLNNPKMAQIDIRGFGETAPSNVLFLIDGRRINGIDMSGADLAQIPVDMIEKVEIYRGPATVLFGDNAVAGAINIILKKGEGKPKARASVISGSYGLFSPKLSVLGKQDKFSYYALASSYDTDGYRHNNNLRTKDLFGNFSFDALKTLTLYLQTGFHKDTYGLPGPLSHNELKTGQYGRKDSKTPDDSADTEDNFVALGADIKPYDDIVLSLNGSYRTRHNSAQYPASNWYTMRTLKTYGFTPKITVKKPIGNMKNTLVAGFDYYKNPTRATDFSPGLWGTDSVTKITRTDYAFYINEELSPVKDLIISAGYRIQKSFWDIDYVDNL
ncbi:MAG TPA: TonB-dependent receptor plug domain-containing protein, partial [Syntrophorhabdaceae bacterium]|nr:TonB-dependent receptor plug domain-containing protein [Syntrophorhabdaceae bacterium]